MDLALLASALRTVRYIDMRLCTAMYGAIKLVHAAYGDAFCTHARGSTTMYVSVCPRAAMYGAVSRGTSMQDTADAKIICYLT